MKLEIVSPEKIVYNGQAEAITLPGMGGLFTILDRHAPIIAALGKGKLTYSVDGAETELAVDGGFVEVKKNIVSVCVE
ncbi:MAG: F0F1 ATP synthase subunit epsilon [Dysgonamonadaceae bacterium]|jgi:F-type H+-transporting ATPase subunit epsilon|nr:F0F1 ATP synthase subunit epsilon [Dysgonamonadaceae bacterium]